MDISRETEEACRELCRLIGQDPDRVIKEDGMLYWSVYSSNVSAEISRRLMCRAIDNVNNKKG